MMINTKYKRVINIFGIILFLFLSANASLDAQTYGNTWENGNLTASLVLRDVVFTGDTFVAVGDFGMVYTSVNGTTWTKRNSGYSGGAHLFGVTYGNGMVVAVGRDELIIRSLDEGVSWETVNPMSGNVYDEDIYKVAFGNNKFVAVGELGGTWRSDDGVNWTKGSISAGSRYITFGDGWFVIATAPGKLYRSQDGVSWSYIYIGQHITAVHYGNSMWLAVGSKIWTSTNGVTWTQRLNLADYGIVRMLYSVTTAPSSFIAAGEGGLMLNSADGVTWRKGNITTRNFIFGMKYGNSVVAGVGNGGPREPLTYFLHSTHYSPEGGTPGPILEPPSGNTIKITSPNGGEVLEGGANFTIKWTGSITFDKVDIEYYNGSQWVVIVNGTKDDGSYTWTVPKITTSKARLWMKGTHSSGNAVDYTDGTFTIAGEVAEINITAPNGGEILTGGNVYTILWQSSIPFDKVDIEYYNGSQWVVIKNNTEDDGEYAWTVPNISTTKAKLWIKGWSESGNPVDYTDNNFTIVPAPSGSLTVTSPNGGEVWAKGSTENITWATTGEVGNVKVSYSTDNGFSWKTIDSSTKNDGSFAWTLPEILADECLVKVNEIANSQISDISNDVFSIGGPPLIVLNRNRFNFGYIKNGASPCPQTLFIYNGGGGTLNWSAEADASWINLNPTSGTGGGTVTIAIDTIGLDIGSYMGTITVSDPDVDNSPQTAEVYLTVKNSSQDEIPFGTFASPEDGLTGVTGSIAVTGWALDDTCVESLKIYREVNGGLSFIGDAVFVEGPRPDVEQAYPDYPNNYKAGWGYMMLTNFLPDGQLVLKAIVKDTSGHEVVLGTKTITVDNAHAVKPFGAIDTPDQGGNASGARFRNNGWALTPQPYKVPEDGSTIKVFIDGVLVGNANYSLYRADIAGLFPGYANSNGAWAYLDIDTTTYANGLHTIAWSVTDSAGRTDGVGSRYFSIQNTGATSNSSAAQHTMGCLPTGSMLSPNLLSPKSIDLSSHHPIKFKTGYSKNIKPQEVYPDEEGNLHFEIKELERIEIQLNKNINSGYQVVGNEFRPLPVGARLDPEKGIFCWQLGAGFLGNYELVFLGKQETGNPFIMRIHLEINPKYSRE
jgi:hypothetical protein